MDFRDYTERMIVLTEGQLGLFSAKTAASVIRYRTHNVIAVLDTSHAGHVIDDVLGFGGAIPIVAHIDQVRALRPTALLIGVAPAGGQLPPRMRQHVADAIRAGIAIISGLHERLNQDAELAALARQQGVPIFDIRDPGRQSHLAWARARELRVKRVLTVGTDCVVGKMVTSLELFFAAQREGLDAAFVATGQTGIMIEGAGVAIDAVVSDFAAGAVEQLVTQYADRQICFIEGQGSLAHPAYSAVTLALIHGSCPDAMVMCHRPDRRHYHGSADCPLMPLDRQIRLYEAAAAAIHPAPVVAVAVNTAGMEEPVARRHIDAVEAETALPACDPVRDGVERILQAVRHAVAI